MNELKLKVEGMHCKSCETLVTEELADVSGVKGVEASHTDGTVKVKYEGRVDAAAVRKKITELGYKVKD
jgi:copper chaperone CopZ